MFEVTKEEFEKFIANYPRKLETHWVYFCTPEICMYLDSMEYWQGCSDYCGMYCVGGITESYLGTDREYRIGEEALKRYGLLYTKEDIKRSKRNDTERIESDS